MQREALKLKGDIKDVCAELEREARRCKGMTVPEWLRLRRVEKAQAKQYGMSENEYRKMLTNENTCVCCGAIIPEGTQYCMNCREGKKNERCT